MIKFIIFHNDKLWNFFFENVQKPIIVTKMQLGTSDKKIFMFTHEINRNGKSIITSYVLG